MRACRSVGSERLDHERVQRLELVRRRARHEVVGLGRHHTRERRARAHGRAPLARVAEQRGIGLAEAPRDERRARRQHEHAPRSWGPPA